MSSKEVIVSLALAASRQFVALLGESSDSETETEYEATFEATVSLRLRGSSQAAPRIRDYVETTIPSYSDRQFREHFRLTRSTFEQLEIFLGPVLSGPANARPTIPVRVQLMCTLWLLATPDSFRSVGDRFNVSKSLAHDVFVRVVGALCDMADRVIVWPRGQNVEVTKERFRRLGPLPNVIGAIDGSHIPIPEPHEDGIYYKTRKMEFAVTLQAVCDADLLFTDCFVGFPGSVPDVRVFRNSDLWKNVRENRRMYFPGEEYIIADKAYPVLSWCIPPFINRGNLRQDQINFSHALSQMRQVIERAFALLKGRFRRLKYLDMKKIDLVPHVVLACCVLHNICLREENNNDDFIVEGNDGGVREVEDRRGDELIQEVPNEPQGVERRNYLVNFLADVA